MPLFEITSGSSSSFVVSGELDMETVHVFEKAVEDGAGAEPLTLELSDLTFLDSTGLRAILDAATEPTSRCVILHGVRDQIRRLFEISGLTMVSNLHIIPHHRESNGD
jgi:anti-anti-sigma factor